jgi:hypothetical protein
MSTSEPPFAEHLADVADGSRVVETFGLGPPLLAIALASADVYFLVGPRRGSLDAIEYAVLAVLLAAALGAIAYEVRRRRQRAVLVVADVGVGVYREGHLCGSMSERTLVASRAYEPGTAKGVLLLMTVALMFGGYGLTEEGDLPSRILAMAPGVYLAVLAGSFARAALLCASFHLPGSRTRALLSRTELAGAGLRVAAER